MIYRSEQVIGDRLFWASGLIFAIFALATLVLIGDRASAMAIYLFAVPIWLAWYRFLFPAQVQALAARPSDKPWGASFPPGLVYLADLAKLEKIANAEGC